MIKRIEHHLRALRARLRFSLAKRIVLGSAGVPSPGWLLTDKDSLDISNRASFAQYWKPNSRSVFLAEHVWEHLNDDEAEKAYENCFEFLKRGGRLRIAVPDGFHPSAEYIDYVRPGGTGFGSDDHKVLYNYKLITEQIKKAGFEVVLLEYWDEQGDFHFRKWLSSDGYISRSKDHDERNQGGTLNYTSLIVDAIKPRRHP